MSQNYSWPATTVPAPVGGATAANQVLEIAQLTAINANTDGLEASSTATANSVASIDTKTPALGQALAAASVPIVLTAAQISTLTPQINALTDTQLRATPVPVSGTVSTGGLTDTQLRATPVPVSLTSTTITGTVAATQSGAWAVTANAGTNLNTSALALETTQAAMSAKLPAALGQTTMAASLSVAIASNQSTLPVSQGAVATTATLANVSGATSSTSIFASNGSAKARQVTNDSTASLYLKFGTTASATSYTVLIPPQGYYEFPLPVYTGAVDGIWTAANGAARTTEVV